MTKRGDAEALARSLPARPYVGGQWQSRNGADRFDVVDPVTERTIATVAEADQETVDDAVSAARSALDGGEWGRLDGPSRGQLLNALAQLIEDRSEDFCNLESVDIGKPAFEPRVIDLPQTVATFRHYAGWADKLEGRTIPTPGYMGRATLSYTIREPIGVVAAITPWNSPTMIGAWKIAPALAAGCAVVLKPPEDAPLTSLLLAQLVEQAGFPAGAFAVLPGRGPTTGSALTHHRGVDKISFTGSPQTGHQVAVAAADGFRPTTMELGGKSPQIVFADADLDAAADGVALGIFANQGQVCAAGSRILVARAVHDEFVELLTARAARVVLGDPFDDATSMGALINAKQRDRVARYIEAGISEGARVVAGGGRPGRNGFFVEPTLFADVDNSMTIAREEIFGPVGAIMVFDDDEQAVAIANDSRYALAATLWTRDLVRAHTVAKRVQAGAVAVNGWSPLDPRLPWGGAKFSGNGRELGRAGLESYTEEKTITIVL
ncbi:aldehyde dehydrogenase family protein [Mycolicibacterium sp. CH28]|uniref:aldehyde dehydrogenase family protein n=1 Tax=Mycolicibacterium sp. CH28 TaxID=2512237 RepID=UPI0010822BE8|nr:aldehyde dehydrogenase family protein [Mycolicibacterium sp. CH28]TGD88034.1 aldehyde dehydrogenase family protein [Mycolicibacterium sp. CH28]